jgi:hypothetical protein
MCLVKAHVFARNFFRLKNTIGSLGPEGEPACDALSAAKKELGILKKILLTYHPHTVVIIDKMIPDLTVIVGHVMERLRVPTSAGKGCTESLFLLFY